MYFLIICPTCFFSLKVVKIVFFRVFMILLYLWKMVSSFKIDKWFVVPVVNIFGLIFRNIYILLLYAFPFS